MRFRCRFRLFAAVMYLVGSFSMLSAAEKCCRGADLHLLAGVPNILSNTNPVQFENDGVVRGLVPPDTCAAVGPKSVISMVNCMIAIHRKDTLEQVFLESTTSFFEEGARGGDVWTIYDQFSHRFFVLAFRPFIQDDVQLTRIFLAVSKDCNPQNSFDFHKYLYIAPEFADYPKMAIDNEAVYITTNDFSINGDLVGATIAAFAKASLVEGSSSYEITPIFRETLPRPSEPEGGDSQFVFPCQPRPTKEKNGVEKVLLIQAVLDANEFINTGNKIRVYQVKNVLNNGKLVFSDVSVPCFTSQDGFNGSGSTLYAAVQPPPVVNTQNRPIVGMETIMGLFNNGAISGKSLWTSHVVFSTDGEYRKIARWYQIDVSKFLKKGSLKLAQVGDADVGGSTSQIFPSVNVDKDGNMAIQFTLVGPQQYPLAAYTGRLKDDPKGTVRLPCEAVAGGDLYYQVTFADANRYGDYTTISVDPCDGKTFWFINQYPFAVDPNAKDSLGRVNFGFGSNWTTFLGAYQINPCGEKTNAPSTRYPLCPIGS